MYLLFIYSLVVVCAAADALSDHGADTKECLQDTQFPWKQKRVTLEVTHRTFCSSSSTSSLFFFLLHLQQYIWEAITWCHQAYVHPSPDLWLLCPQSDLFTSEFRVTSFSLNIITLYILEQHCPNYGLGTNFGLWSFFYRPLANSKYNKVIWSCTWLLALLFGVFF